jgi:hypothetical protein
MLFALFAVLLSLPALAAACAVHGNRWWVVVILVFV